MSRPAVAIVDPFFSGANFPLIVQRQGYRPIGIRTLPDTIEPPPPADMEWLTYNGATDAIVEACRARGVVGLFAGCENGVLLADLLSEALGLSTTNGTRLSHARRHKGEMKDAFRASGVPCARFATLSSLSVSEAQERMRETKLSFPIVLKPAMGYGTIGVRICRQENDLRQALEFFRHTDFSSFEIPDATILMEEFLDGEEYVVNSIGDGATILATDLWRYEKADSHGSWMYKSDFLLDPDAPESRIIVPVALAAVRALGIRFGAAHTELKITSNGPRVLEVGSRIAGSHMATLAGTATGNDFETEVVRASLGHPLRLTSNQLRLQRQAMKTVLMVNRAGTVTRIDGLEEIRSLPSFHSLYLSIRPGQRVGVTTDALTIGGMVHLAHDDRRQLLRDAGTCDRAFNIEVK